MSDFVKFPRTPHLFVLPQLDIRDDKILPVEQSRSFYSDPIIVEEKVDGANTGISFSNAGELRVQNRGNYIESGHHPQFDQLWPWVYERVEDLRTHLTDRYILFGEWCFSKHSILYTELPDWFLGFDVYDRVEQYFLSVNDRNDLFRKCAITPINQLGYGTFNKKDLITLMNEQKSSYSNEKIEGLYLRREENNKLALRAKIVRADFVQSIGKHWSKEKPVNNVLA